MLIKIEALSSPRSMLYSRYKSVCFFHKKASWTFQNEKIYNIHQQKVLHFPPLPLTSTRRKLSLIKQNKRSVNLVQTRMDTEQTKEGLIFKVLRIWRAAASSYSVPHHSEYRSIHSTSVLYQHYNKCKQM